jgi:16S rRNA pseudouridine516 synthase
MANFRLDKIISDTGAATRRETKELIRQGRVTVNGRIAASAEEKYDPDAVSIVIDGRPVQSASYFYYMLHKPAGVLTATEDRTQKTVIDLLPERLQRQGLFPVGRLDKDTTGLLILTNDGGFAHRLMSPKSKIPKVYYAVVDGRPEEADIQAFGEGVVLADGTKCLPARLALCTPGGTEVLVTVYEGKYHQVKRMLASRGTPVLALKRLSIGGVELDPDLEPGETRELTAAEKTAIFRAD